MNMELTPQEKHNFCRYTLKVVIKGLVIVFRRSWCQWWLEYSRYWGDM